MTERSMSLKALARASGETAETIRLCEREGLLGPASAHGYDASALAILRLVRIGQRLRIPLEEIKTAASTHHAESGLTAVIRSWALRRLAHIAREQDELNAAQTVLCGFIARSQAAEAGTKDRALQDLARLHRDLVGGSAARTGPGRPPATRPSPSAARAKASGAKSVGRPSVRNDEDRSDGVRFVL